MLNKFIIAFIFLLLTSCRDNSSDVSSINPLSSDLMPLKIKNEWVYRTSHPYDPSLADHIDTIRIVRDSLTTDFHWYITNVNSQIAYNDSGVWIVINLDPLYSNPQALIPARLIKYPGNLNEQYSVTGLRRLGFITSTDTIIKTQAGNYKCYAYNVLGMGRYWYSPGIGEVYHIIPYETRELIDFKIYP
jgi:hypothetical protein